MSLFVAGFTSSCQVDEGMLVSECLGASHSAPHQEDTGQRRRSGGHEDLGQIQCHRHKTTLRTHERERGITHKLGQKDNVL